MIAPSKSPITVPFGKVPGYTVNNGFHTGVDFSHVPDNRVYMPEDGIVQVVPWNGKSQEGNAIYVNVGNRRHLLGHLAEFKVSNGQNVKQGQVVAIMGQTGLAFGVHLHWGLALNGTLVNGMDYVTKEDTVTRATEQIVATLAKAFLNDDLSKNPGLKAYIGQPIEDVINVFNTAAQRDAYLKALAVNADKASRYDGIVSNPDQIVITKKGWEAVWQALKSFFSKNN